DPGEQCDDGNNLNGDGCDSNCKEECGNDTLDPGEQCDDGNILSGDGCSSVCTLEVPQGCGNGIVEPGEECDEGSNNGVNGDSCNTDCTDNTFESANVTVPFDHLTDGQMVTLSAPDPRGNPSALAVKDTVLPATCTCEWSIQPTTLGSYSNINA